MQLRGFTGDLLSVVGGADVKVEYGQQCANLSLIIVKEGPHPLLGRDWLQHIRLDWPSLFKMHSVCGNLSHGDTILDEFPSVFADGLGSIAGFTATIHLDKSAVPKCFPPRLIPYALKHQVNLEIDRLVKEGIVVPVDHAKWASPIVIVRKKDGSIRLCADFKVTINKFIDPNQHPIPNPSDLLTSIAGGKVFSKLDLSQAYAQLSLSPASQELCVIATHRGLYAYTRLPFGVSSAPAIWQKTIEQVLAGLEGVICYFDDILVSGSTQAEHDDHLRQVLQRFEQAGLRLRKSKCSLNQSEVQYLGFIVSHEGLKPDPSKVQAILDACQPTDVATVHSFLGLVNFYARFIPNCSKLMAPLNALLKKDASFEWNQACQEAFDKIKFIIASPTVLVHYDPTKPAVVDCDASSYGIGACLLQPDADGKLRPVCFVSRSLASAEKNYSQIEKEALAIVFAVKRLHQYLYGRMFTLRTDHKPLLKIFGSKNGLPPLAAARLHRWAVLLSEYSYSVEYISGASNVIADCLSRLPEQMSDKDCVCVNALAEDFVLDPCISIPISASDVAKATADDPVLMKVVRLVQSGWSCDISSDLQPFFRIRNELFVERGCLLWNNRVVIPIVFRRHLLAELHSVHVGIVRMKSIARSFFWWPKLDEDIASLVSECTLCQEFASMPRKESVHHWAYPTRPFERVHVDFAEFQGSHYFVIVDAFSKWVDVFHMGSSTTTARTIQCLLRFMSTYGIPLMLVSDNGPQFVSAEFDSFCKQNGIRHKRTPPYHPASNGQVERVVQELKKALRKNEGVDISTTVSRFLISYRNTPHSVTNQSPANVIFRSEPVTRFSFLRPNIGFELRNRHEEPQEHSRSFEPGQRVWVYLPRDHRWFQASVLRRIGPLTYSVQLGTNVRHVHVEHMRLCVNNFSSFSTDKSGQTDVTPTLESTVPTDVTSSPESSMQTEHASADTTPSLPDNSQSQEPERRRSERTAKERQPFNIISTKGKSYD